MNQISVLLSRYMSCYFRVKGHFLADFLFAIIIGTSLALINFRQGLSNLFMVTFLFFIPFTYMGVSRAMVGEIVMEKTLKLKEFLKLNGVTDFSYQMYCLIVTLFKVLLYSTFMALGAVVANLTADNETIVENFLALPSLYFLSGLASVGYILLISVFFKDAKFASDVSGFLYVILSICGFAVLITNNHFVFLIVCLFPQCALTLGLISQMKNIGNIPITYTQIHWMLFVDAVVYIVLYIYFDLVVDDDNGVKKHWLFCLSRKPRRRTYTELRESLIDEANNDTSSAIYHEKMVFETQVKKYVEVKAISKSFKDLKAVDDVSFPMYPGQILSLLGHNGAGKTTTISLLSGLLDIDSGMIYYDGKPFYSNLEEARTQIGLCCQGDILFPNYTVLEHLELIAKLHQIKVANLNQAIQDTAAKLDLTSEGHKYSQHLSGGNKRKLSLAMAIIGDTKVVFLDEPTSGMDPQIRRIIWHHIRQLKSYGLTILMTTHHLDEADELSDRIAIMSKGKLLAMGSSEFIKKSFGAGYYLTIVSRSSDEKKIDQISDDIESIIKNHVPSFKRDEQTSSQVLKYLLPFSSQKNFSPLFKELEYVPEIQISLQMNSLDDTFVNIGLKEEELINPSTTQEALKLEVPLPQCMNRPPRYDFKEQYYAMIRRKKVYTLRTFRNIFLTIMPALVLILATIIQKAVGASELGFFAFFQSIAYSLHTAIYCAFPVYEREENLKYVMDVMGLRRWAYWLGTLTFDMISIFTINIVQTICFCVLYYSNEYVAAYYSTPLEVFLFTIPFTFSLITLSYAYSFMFSKALSAVKYFPVLYFTGISMFMNMIVFMLISKASSGFQSNNFLVTILFGVSFFLCPSNIYNALMSSNYNIFAEVQLVTSIPVGCLWLIVIGLFYLFLAVHIEKRRNKFKEEPPLLISEINQQFPIDYQEIGAESQRTMNSSNDEIKVVGLEKQYKSKYIQNALKGITFGVKPGEIFGLLGPNGAGKSTTFNILTALLPKSKGSVQLLGQEVNRNMPEIYQQVGICPQFNCLWDVLTVQEHIELFGAIKGYNENEISDSVRYFSEILSLGSHLHKRSMNLSGGNKRKLCVANCLIGSPKLMFFDEPSSGLDPLARRFLWNSLQQALKTRQSSIVLTTHSMAEAESLAHKTGILINGKFFCIGPTEMLKSKYGSGYKLTILVREGKPPITDEILRLFPGANKIVEGFLHQETFQVDPSNFKFSEAFSKLEEFKDRGAIKDFSIYNTTLEQVFLYFSRFQYSTGEVPN
jgi:ATP-binding cassette, subfamily A (ABC1), member 3